MKKQLVSKVCLIMTSIILFGTTVHAAEVQTDSQKISVEMVNSLTQLDAETASSDAVAVNQDQWILLEDMQGTEYAYFVPLSDATSIITGYSVVSFVGGNRTLTTAIGENASMLAENIINATDTADAMIYEFPNAFICNNNGLYYKICMDGEMEVISDPSTYESSVVSFLSSSIASNASTRATTVYGSLDNWDSGDFVPVSVSNGYYYGGYQGWLTEQEVSEFYANRSCGVTAAANMLYYMSENVSGMSDLYTRSGISKSQFNAFQKDVYEYLSPAIWGIPTLDTMIDRVEEFASAQGVSLSATRSSDSWTEANVRDYIADGLNGESPVLLLTWNSPIEDLTMHWVTITRIYNAGAGTKIITSNWAEKQTYDFATWVNGSSIYKGVIYFE